MNVDDGHAWRTRSTHPTSEGRVTYQSCHCGAWRVIGRFAAPIRIPSTGHGTPREPGGPP